MKNALIEPLIQVESPQRLVFERILGHPEIMGANKWQNSISSRCRLCNKSTFCIFVWNYEVQKDKKVRFKHYKQSLGQPLIFAKDYESNHPALILNRKTHKMMQLDEFMDRLQIGKSSRTLSYRGTASLVEDKKREVLKEKIRAKMLDE